MMSSVQRWLLVALGAWTLTPIGVLVLRAFAQSWRFPELLPPVTHVSAFVGVLASPRIVDALATSLLLAAATGIASTAAGFALARSAARGSRRLRLLTLALALFAVVAPPIALGVGLQVAMLGVGLSGTLVGVWLAHLVPAVGYVTLFADGVFTTFDFAVDDEARTLGASPWQALWRLTVPMLKDRLGEGVVLGGLVSWGQLAITALIGGGLVRTLPVELMAFVRAGDDRLGAAAGLVLTLPPLIAIGLLQVGRRRPGASL